MFGIYVNEDGYIPYAHAIVHGYKTVETRSRDVFKALFKDVLQRDVLIIKTRHGKQPCIIGYVTLKKGCFCPRSEFQNFDLFSKHLVPPDSKYDCTGKGKWLYGITFAMPIKPIQLTPDMVIKRHGRNYVELNLN